MSHIGLGDVCTHARRTFARALTIRSVSLTLTIQFLHCFFILGGFFFFLILDMHMRFAPCGVASALFSLPLLVSALSRRFVVLWVVVSACPVYVCFFLLPCFLVGYLVGLSIPFSLDCFFFFDTSHLLGFVCIFHTLTVITAGEFAFWGHPRGQ